MLDDLFKNAIVLIDGHYVKTPSDLPAATAAKALWAALKKDGWYDVRILGLTDVIGDADDVPRDTFEQTAAKKLLAAMRLTRKSLRRRESAICASQPAYP